MPTTAWDIVEAAAAERDIAIARTRAGPRPKSRLPRLPNDHAAAQARLVVLQGLDASGKDSTIKHVISGINPQGVTVRSCKEPSAEELNHDFLCRRHAARPPRWLRPPPSRLPRSTS